jgi:hypothetical protein
MLLSFKVHAGVRRREGILAWSFRLVFRIIVLVSAGRLFYSVTTIGPLSEFFLAYS